MAMEIRIVYETNSGGTYLVATYMAEILIAKGFIVQVKKASEVSEDYLFFDGLTILGSPSWDFSNGEGKRFEGYPHEMMYDLINCEVVRENTNQKFACFGLGDHDYTFFSGAVDHLEKYVEKVGGVKVGESLRIGEFYFDKDKNLERVENWVVNLVERL